MNVTDALLVAFFAVGLALTVARLPVLHPLQIWMASLGLGVTCYSMKLLPYKALHPFTVWLLVGATVAFAAGVKAGSTLFNRLATPGQDATRTVDLRRATLLVLGLGSIAFAAFLVNIILDFGLTKTVVISSDVRLQIGTGLTFFTIKYIYFSFAAIGLCATLAARPDTRSANLRWLAAILAVLASLYFSTGRANIVTGLTIGIVAFALSRYPHIPRRSLPLLGVAFLVVAVIVFSVGGSIIGKTFDTFQLRTVQSTFTEHPRLKAVALPYHYAAAPVPALDREVAVTGMWGRAHGCALLSLACRGLAKLGVPVTPEPITLRAFTAEPLRWNTYTALDLPLIDGGRVLAMPIVALLGVLVGLAWEPARKRNVYGILVYSLIFPALIYAGTINHFFAPHLLGAMAITATSLAWTGWRSRRRMLVSAT